MKRILPVCVVLLLACESSVVTGPESVQPELPASLSIIDAGREGGLEGFWWMKPIVDTKPRPDGALDPSWLPFLKVEVCEWAGGGCAGPPLASFTADTGVKCRDRLRIVRSDDDCDDDGPDDEEDRFYQATWRTRDAEIDPAHDYRVLVRLGDLILGHADVDIVEKNKEAKQVDRTESAVLRAGGNLRIRFLVTSDFQSAGIADATGGSVSLDNGNVTLNVPAGALTAPTALSAVPIVPDGSFPVSPAVPAGLAFRFGPAGTQFAQPVTMVMSFDPASLPSGVDPAELRIHKLVNGAYIQMDAGNVDAAAGTISAEVNSFSPFVGVPRNPTNDNSGPRIRSIEVFDPLTQTWGASATLETATSDAALLTRVHMTDDGAGVRVLNYNLTPPNPRHLIRRLCTSRTLALTSGSDTNGQWECPQTWPQYSEPGTWVPSQAVVFDRANNGRRYVASNGLLCDEADPTECIPNPPTVTVTGAISDVAFPTISDVSVGLATPSPVFGKALTVTQQSLPATWLVRLTVSDDLAGVIGRAPNDFPFLNATRVTVTGPNGLVLGVQGICAPSSGTPTSGTLDCPVDLRAGAAIGPWQITRLDILDRVGSFIRFQRDAAGDLCDRVVPTNCLSGLPVVDVVDGLQCNVGGGSALTLENAITAAQAGDTIRICGGTHDLSGMNRVNKSLHLVGIGSVKPVIDPAPVSLGVAGAPFGIENLELRYFVVSVVGSDVTISRSVFSGEVRTRIDQIGDWRMEDSQLGSFRLTGPPGGNPSSVSLVDNRIQGSVRFDEGPPVAELDGNDIVCPPFESSRCLWLGSTGGIGRLTISENTIDCGKGRGECVLAQDYDTQMIDNYLRATLTDPNGFGKNAVVFRGAPRGSVFRGNLVEGIGGARSPDGQGFPFSAVDCTSVCSDFSGNTLIGVASVTFDVPATDLVLRDVWGLFSTGGLHRSDLDGLILSPRRQEDLTCNWWGDADVGPRAIDRQAGGSWANATPWATAPIANGAGGLCDGRDFEPVPVQFPQGTPQVFQDIWGNASGGRFWAVAGEPWQPWSARGAVFSYDASRGSFVADSSGPFITPLGLPSESAGVDLVAVDGWSNRAFAASLVQPITGGHAQVLRMIDPASPGKWNGTNTWGATLPGRLPGRPLSSAMPVALTDIAVGSQDVVAVGRSGTAYQLVEAPCTWCATPSGEYWTSLLLPDLGGIAPDLLAVDSDGLTTIAVGENGVILRKIRDDSEGQECSSSAPACSAAWQVEASGVTANILSVHALPDGTWLAGTESGELLERTQPFDGTWRIRTDLRTHDRGISAIWGAAPDDLFLARGGLEHFGPSGWTLISLPLGAQPKALWGTADGSVVIVVSGSQVWRWVRRRP